MEPGLKPGCFTARRHITVCVLCFFTFLDLSGTGQSRAKWGRVELSVQKAGADDPGMPVDLLRFFRNKEQK